MSATQFTPGQWRVVSMAYNVKNGPQTEFGVVNSDRMNEADASLIAAAPELYEALENLLNADVADLSTMHPDLARTKALAALRKARGES